MEKKQWRKKRERNWKVGGFQNWSGKTMLIVKNNKIYFKKLTIFMTIQQKKKRKDAQKKKCQKHKG